MIHAIVQTPSPSAKILSHQQKVPERPESVFITTRVANLMTHFTAFINNQSANFKKRQKTLYDDVHSTLQPVEHKTHISEPILNSYKL